jgi:hypothetical protein
MTDANERRLLALERRVAILEEYFKNIDEADIPNSLSGLAKAIIAIKDRLEKHSSFIKDSATTHLKHEELFKLTDEKFDYTNTAIRALFDFLDPMRSEQEKSDFPTAEQQKNSGSPNSKD